VCIHEIYVLVPLRDKTAVSVAKHMWSMYSLKYGAGEILTDNGGEFCCELLNEICRLMALRDALRPLTRREPMQFVKESCHSELYAFQMCFRQSEKLNRSFEQCCFLLQCLHA